MNVRSARPEDAPAIAGIHVRTWQHAYRGHLPDAFLDALTPADRLAMWSGMLAAPRPRSMTLVVDDGAGVIGFCDVGHARLPDDPDVEAIGEVYAIYVLPGAQGMGAGRVLMDAACAALRTHGFTDAMLWVLAGNVPAIAFYERMGWEAEGAVKQEEIGGTMIEEHCYRRDLT